MILGFLILKRFRFAIIFKPVLKQNLSGLSNSDVESPTRNLSGMSSSGPLFASTVGTLFCTVRVFGIPQKSGQRPSLSQSVNFRCLQAAGRTNKKKHGEGSCDDGGDSLSFPKDHT